MTEKELDEIGVNPPDEIAEDEYSESEVVRLNYPLKSNNDDANTIYIIDDAQLLADLKLEDDAALFGSGQMLSDFITFTGVSSQKSRKIIFIGDDQEILRGEELSALSNSYLENKFSINVKYFKLTAIFYGSTTSKLILENAKNILLNLDENLFNELKICADESKVFNVQENHFGDVYQSNDFEERIMIGYSNKQVFDANKNIRSILKKAKDIEIGDKIILHNTIHFRVNGIEHSVYAGEFGEVIDVGEKELFKYKIRQSNVSLSFQKVCLLFHRLSLAPSLLILEDFLNSDIKEISAEERMAIVIRAKKNFKSKHPKEKLHRNYLRKQLKTDEYFNVALVKYAYAITCHRAQSWKWKNVFIDCETDQGKENETYFRWLYTAVKSAKQKLYFLNLPKITPYVRLNIRINPTAFDRYSNAKQKGDLADIPISSEIKDLSKKYQFADNSTALKLFAYCNPVLTINNLTVERIQHFQYQEVYYLIDAVKNKIKLTFYYNNKDQITKLIVAPIDDIRNRVKALFFNENNDYSHLFKEAKFLENFYFLLLEKIEPLNVKIENVNKHNYLFEVTFKEQGSFLAASIYYEKSGFITSVLITKYNSEELLKKISTVFNSIKES